MDTTQEMLKYVHLLYQVAYSKTNDSNDADDLVQETYLSTLKALNSGTEIKNIRAYLLKVLDNAYYGQLNCKNKRFKINIAEPLAEPVTEDIGLQKSEAARDIRRELAYLSKKHREIMVQFYMEGKSVNEIAKNLNIAIGTVKSRLDRGREKIKKGIEKMDSYAKNSYQPDTLSLVVAGVTGLNNEPLSVMTNSIEQNLLIMAYNEPIKISDLSKKIGIPMAYTEELVDKLVKHEFMKSQGSLVWTNFLIMNDDLLKDKKEAQKDFVDSTFSEVIEIFNSLVHEYKNTGILSKFNDTQLYLYGLNYTFLSVYEYLIDTLKLLKSNDYPERPNGGKWIIHFGKKVSNDEFINSFRLESEFRSQNYKRIVIKLWDTPMGSSPWRNNNNISPEIFGRLLHDIHTGQDADQSTLVLIPDLVRLGFLTNNHKNKKTVNIPIISENDLETLNSINKDYASKLIEIIGDRLIAFINENVLDCPKQITPKSPFVHLLSVSEIAMTYTFRIAKEGIIEINSDKNYPVCVMVNEN